MKYIYYIFRGLFELIGFVIGIGAMLFAVLLIAGVLIGVAGFIPYTIYEVILRDMLMFNNLPHIEFWKHGLLGLLLLFIISFTMLFHGNRQANDWYRKYLNDEQKS